MKILNYILPMFFALVVLILVFAICGSESCGNRPEQGVTEIQSDTLKSTAAESVTQSSVLEKYSWLVFESHGDGTCEVKGMTRYPYYDEEIPQVSPSGDRVTTIGSWAFNCYTGLIKIVIPESVTIIERGAFSCCNNLAQIIIPDSVESIESMAFTDCQRLMNITIPKNVKSVGEGAFACCYSLKSMTIPHGVTKLERDLFQDCINLVSMTIPHSVTSIESQVFKGCTSLTSITYTGTISQWQAVEKGANWNNNTGEYIVHCTDGDLSKSES